MGIILLQKFILGLSKVVAVANNNDFTSKWFLLDIEMVLFLLLEAKKLLSLSMKKIKLNCFVNLLLYQGVIP